jgi:hypothetical protein
MIDTDNRWQYVGLSLLASGNKVKRLHALGTRVRRYLATDRPRETEKMPYSISASTGRRS